MHVHKYGSEVQKMKKGMVRVICGPGSGKSAAAVGYGIMGISQKKRVIMIQFLKGVLDESATEILKRMEPEMKLFRFEHSRGFFSDLPKKQKQEELMNIKNGFNYAKKVMATGQCDVLILDEVLGLVDQHMISLEELEGFLASRDEEIDLVLTGRICPTELEKYVDCISRVENMKAENSLE